ncbi:MAG: Glutathione-regulated potassium-efflux system protein KefB [Flavobacteriales bacterium]|nr:Glutathione-regulated potassium-efflux system protein KefB [Flavobacteriales bacterium]
MILLNIFETTLPLTNPVLLFSLLLFIILFAPLILNKLKIPQLIGLIIAGAIIGPNGLNLMLRDSSIVLFGTVGLLYIMFLAGLEIDLLDFKKNRNKSLVFGIYTFVIPFSLGFLVGHYFLQYSVITSILLASMFSSHTLIAYPMISKLGVAKNRAVNITIGGTIITDVLALLVLAGVAGVSTGEVTNGFWLRLSISVLIFGMIVLFLFPIIGRWFFKRFHDNISQYIFVLAMLFLGAFLAEAAGIEAIIGAFLVGLALNRVIPHTSPLMNRVAFIGNALFIPFFLIGVGMLIDYRVFFKDFETIKVAVTMIVVATTSKFLAAWLTQKTYKFSADERRLIFGLSNAHVAATLAVVLVGYNIILNKAEIAAAALQNKVIEPVRLFDENVLNGTILLILATCTIAAFIAQKGARNIALLENNDNSSEETKTVERILIPLSNIETTNELVNLSVTIKSKKNKKGLYALNIVDNNSNDSAAEKKGKKLMEKAHIAVSATDNTLHELIRYDLNIVNGISSVVMENKITDLVLGVHNNTNISDSFLSNFTEGILTKCNTTTLIYKAAQPLATIKKHLVVVPEKAEKEIGFSAWITKVWNIAKNTNTKMVFYAVEDTLNELKSIQEKHPIDAEFVLFNDWNKFLSLVDDIKADENLIIVLSRKEYMSYHQIMPKIPSYLNTYFKSNSFIIIYPKQMGISDLSTLNLKDTSPIEPMEKLDEIGKTLVNIFKKK